MIRFFVLPILAAILAGALTAGVYFMMDPDAMAALTQGDAGPQVTLVAVAAGAIALAVASYVAAVRLGVTLMKRAQGLTAFEADIRRRISRIEAGLEALDASGLTSGERVKAGGEARSGSYKQGIATAAQHGTAEGGAEKVILFDPATRARSAHLPQARLIGDKLAHALERNRIEAWFQPVVSLPGRKTRFFEAIAYLTDEAEDGSPGAQPARAIEPAYSSAPEIDRRMLLQSLKLLRELDRTGKHAGVIWRLHETALGDAHAFAGIERILDANSALAEKLVARIDHRDFASLDPAQTDRLHRLRELGFPLAIGNCPDTAKARQAVRTSLFSIVVIDVSRIVASEGDERPIHRVIAGEKGQPAVEIIASGVGDEQQAMALIDQDVLLAQGDFFSEPRPMRSAATGTSATGM